METKKLVFKCKVKGLYGVAKVEKIGGVDKITDFFGLEEKEVAVERQEFTVSPDVNINLLPCSTCGGRKPQCCDKSRSCGSFKVLEYQCLYCNKLEIARGAMKAGPFDIYFLMDQSGSMSKDDRVEASKAVRKLMEEMGSENDYSFVAWATEAKFIFKHESRVDKVIDALKLYEEGKTGIKGQTCIDEALKLISGSARRSQREVIVIILTDGGFHNPRKAVEEKNRLIYYKDNINIVAIGITGAKQENLDAVSTIKEFSEVLDSSSGLESTFLSIGEILKSGKYNTK
ncbi:MAG: VWA domain-containing protein [Bacilli bacterium]|nr:VWA domain-containing protein [Bacilli bacterium]